MTSSAQKPTLTAKVADKVGQKASEFAYKRTIGAAESVASRLGGPYYSGAKMVWQGITSEAKAMEETNDLIRQIQEAGPLVINGIARVRPVPHPNIRIGKPKKAPREGQVVLRYDVVQPDKCGFKTMNTEGWIITAILGITCPWCACAPACMRRFHTQSQVPVYGDVEQLLPVPLDPAGSGPGVVTILAPPRGGAVEMNQMTRQDGGHREHEPLLTGSSISTGAEGRSAAYAL